MKDRRQRELDEKKALMRQSMQQKILEENQTRVEVESAIVQMEQDELDLINKLRNT
jgi:hypothetical protein